MQSHVLPVIAFKTKSLRNIRSGEINGRMVSF
jgi:hypothetical protein